MFCDPGRPVRPRPVQDGRAAPASDTTKAPTSTPFRGSIAWPSSSLSTLRRVDHPTQRKTRFQVLVRLSWTGLLTRKVPSKGFRVVSYISFPFPQAWLGANLMEAVPLVGSTLGNFLRGGPEIGANTLTRMFILHIGLLPTAAFILVGLHITLIRMQGVSEHQFEDAPRGSEGRHFRFWPDHVTTELMIGVLLMYVLTLLALVFPATMGPPADPTQTPAHIRPEWYFYFSFRLLKLTSLRLSVVLTVVGGALILFWPFVEQRLRRHRFFTDTTAVILGVIAFLCFLVFTVWESLAA